MAIGLLREGHQADFVLYGASTYQAKTVGPGIGCYYLESLERAANFLVNNYDQVLSIYLYPKDRIRFLLFRRQNRARLRFHQLYLSWPDSPLKRLASFLDGRLYPFNGKLFCVSPRQFQYIRRWSQKVEWLLPPIPENYFLNPENKPRHKKIRVTYIGRAESGKGIEDVISLFTRLGNYPQVEVEIHGFYHERLKSSVACHEWLSSQKNLRYFFTPFKGYTPEIDDNLRLILRDTDILLLPYRKLSSTIDMPLLLLEGMASLCAVITRPFGDIPFVYGPSSFLLSGTDELSKAEDCIVTASESLDLERRRIYQRNNELCFNTESIVKCFIEAFT